MFKKLGLGLFAIVFMFSAMGLSCDDDDATCGDAAKNIVKIFENSDYSQEDFCGMLLQAGMAYEDYNDCLEMSADDGITALKIWCEDDDWDQSDIDCLADANSMEDIEECE
ncbi:MAG: hypothetical protein SVR08_16725 [Spirochaetota bacterium]|nr:hypothetical protein [Spirochaetota bacterium]